MQIQNTISYAYLLYTNGWDCILLGTYDSINVATYFVQVAQQLFSDRELKLSCKHQPMNVLILFRLISYLYAPIHSWVASDMYFQGIV